MLSQNRVVGYWASRIHDELERLCSNYGGLRRAATVVNLDLSTRVSWTRNLFDLKATALVTKKGRN